MCCGKRKTAQLCDPAHHPSSATVDLKDYCPDKQVGRSVPSPYKQPVLHRLYREHRKEGDVSLRPTNSPSYTACTESTARRAKCPFALLVYPDSGL